MRIAHYLDLRQLYDRTPLEHEANRALGLELEGRTPLEQVDGWRVRHLPRLEGERWSRTYERYRYGIGLTLGAVAFVLGLITGAALLSYSGREPVNVIYFLAVAVAIPLVTMVLTLVALLRADRPHNALVHLAPASWMAKIAGLLGHRGPPAMTLPPPVANRLVIVHSQQMALWFSLGLLLALVGIVATRDIAFAWSTTLRIDPQTFHRITEMIAGPWHRLVPTAVPSLELITQSQYYRLGGTVDSELVRHAEMLGAWWRFLAMATLVYAVGLRLAVWLFARMSLQRAAMKAILAMPQTRQLLHEMNTPLVDPRAQEGETRFVEGASEYPRVLQGPLPRTSWAIGWAMEPERIGVVLDALGGAAERIAPVGGRQSLAEDTRLIAETAGAEVLLLVKAWEPPTMEWVDLVTDLAGSAQRVIVVPTGMPDEAFVPQSDHVAVWERKLVAIDLPKVWLWMR